MPSIPSYSKATSLDANDRLVVDNGTTTRSIKPEEITGLLPGTANGHMHRNIYRGRSLGTSLTSAQKTAIANGTFDDLYVGDYWTISSRVFRIADIDYLYNCGDTAFTKHHLIVVNDANLGNQKMNETNVTTGGYKGSEMRTTNLQAAKDIVNAAFPNAVGKYRDYITNAVTNGYPSGGEWADADIELMNEVAVYGSYIFTPGSTGTVTPNRYTIWNSQLALFRLNPRMIKTRYTYWLRDVVSAALFAYVLNNGNAGIGNASASTGVRVAFPVVGN